MYRCENVSPYVEMRIYLDVYVGEIFHRLAFLNWLAPDADLRAGRSTAAFALESMLLPHTYLVGLTCLTQLFRIDDLPMIGSQQAIAYDPFDI